MADALKQLGPTWTAAISSQVHKSFILPLLSFPALSQIIIDLIQYMPGICLTPKALLDLFDNPLSDLGVLAAMLNGAESCGLATAKVFSREIPAWLGKVLRRSLSAVLSSSANCLGAAKLIEAMTDAGWLSRLTADEQRQLAGTCVAAIQSCLALPLSIRSSISSRFSLTVKQGKKINIEYSEASYEPEAKKRKIEQILTLVRTGGVALNAQPELVLPIPVDTEDDAQNEDDCPSLQLDSPSPVSS